MRLFEGQSQRMVGLEGRQRDPQHPQGSCNNVCRDGENHNLSWNCGAEGPTADPGVLRLRARQIRNLAAALLLAHGTPMLHMGDEYGHSKVAARQDPSPRPYKTLDWRSRMRCPEEHTRQAPDNHASHASGDSSNLQRITCHPPGLAPKELQEAC